MKVKTVQELEDLVNERFELSEFSQEYLCRVTLSDVEIVPREIREIDLRCVDFDGVDLTDKTFLGCDLRGASFKRAIVKGSQIRDCPTQGSDIEELLHLTC